MNVKKVLRRYNLKPKEHQDQIFIEDEETQKEVVELANLKDEDRVLEIGAGIGNLTRYIAQNCPVTAIEKDGKLAAVLRHLEIENITVLQRDVMATHLKNLEFNKIVSNLPYSVSTPLTFKLLNLDWDLAVLIYQKEFAERLTGEPGTMNNSRMSLKVNYRCDTELVKVIPSDKFYPEPVTDSAVVRLRKKDVEEKSTDFWKIVKAAFHHKRKLVKNSLEDSAHFLDLDEEEIKDLEGSLPDKRVYQCTLQDFEKIEAVLEDIL
ncbi:MAG: 16S rRNA (adenine(1518)-N(6)/adenine(1519)-N(6))-dimethyltransferase RsmA [Candidatus Aenigmatarchaeota archaeon]